MLRALKELIHAIVSPVAVPIGYLGSFALIVATIFSRAQIGMYVLIALIPLPTIWYNFHPYPLGKDFIDIFIFAVILGIYVNKGGFKPTRSGTLLIVFIVVNYIALWHASLRFNLAYPITTENELLRDWKNYAEMIFLYFLVHNSVRNEEQQKIAMAIVGSVMLFICVREFRNFSPGDAFSYDKRVEGPFWVLGLGANHMGAFVAHYSAMLFGAYLVDTSKGRRRLYMAAILFSLHPLFFTYSRGAYLAAIAALFFFGLVRKRSLLILVLVLGLSWQFVLPSTVVERITMTEEPTGQLEESAAKRVELWEHAVSLFKANPVFGVGFGAFGLSLPKGGVEGLTDTHNFYLRMLSEQGLIGVTFFLVILAAAFRSGWVLYGSGRTPFHKSLGMGFMGCVIAETVTNLFGDRWSYFALGSYFFILWGLVDRASQLAQETEAQKAPLPANVAGNNGSQMPTGAVVADRPAIPGKTRP